MSILKAFIIVALLWIGVCWVTFRAADGIVNHRVENRTAEYAKEAHHDKQETGRLY